MFTAPRDFHVLDFLFIPRGRFGISSLIFNYLHNMEINPRYTNGKRAFAAYALSVNLSYAVFGAGGWGGQNHVHIRVHVFTAMQANFQSDSLQSVL